LRALGAGDLAKMWARTGSEQGVQDTLDREVIDRRVKSDAFPQG